MNTHYTPSAPAHLRIWQQNTRKSQSAHHHVLNTDPSLYDLIFIQEPWIDSFGNARGNRHWRIIYPSNRYLDNHNTIRSIILVNTNISTDSYIPLNIPHSDITAIRLKGEFGHCSLFNIYNDCTNNSTTDALRMYLDTNAQVALPSPTDHMFWLGDFNRHHPLWEDDSNRRLFSSSNLVDPLIDLINDYDMVLTLPPGIPTYETAAGNWTRPDNVWRSNNPEDPIISCNVDPSIRPPRADHLPIITELDLSVSRAPSFPTRNMRDADFTAINEKLRERLALRCPAIRIRHKEDVETTVNTLVDIINEVIDEEVPASKPSPFAKRWWTKELTELKKEKNRLSNLSYKHRGMPDAPVHAKHKEAVNTFCNRLEEIKKEHWTNWLEEATSKDVYIAGKYITSEPSDYSNARIPSLKTTNHQGVETLATENATKAEALVKTFFPPPPPEPTLPSTAYPEPLKSRGIFSRDDIRAAIKKLKPYKAPGSDGIQNIVLQKCAETLINHLYYIFRAILELDTYPSRWLNILTIILRKAGKAAYNVAKAYRPIGLLETLGKLFSTLIAADLSFLAEKYNLLPPTQFGGRPGRRTTDAMHLIVSKIKDAWRAGKVASVLFLDVQAAFPNTVKARLLHNMKSRRVPEPYIRLFDKMLSDRKTQLRFDDYLSDPIHITNGTTQGCPLSMLLYAFYNADLIDVAKGKDELASGFVDDCAFVTVGDTLDITHDMLKDMMERGDGGLDWSHVQNSPFELSKLAVMDFARTPRDIASAPLTIDKTNPDGTTTTHTISSVDKYKYLGVTFDPKLTWRAHVTKVVASATWWSQQLWRVSKTAGGLSPSKTRQLYNTVAVPAFTYASDVWYVPPFKLASSKNARGSVGVTKLFQSIQGRIARYITGGIRGTAYDVLEAHAHILPVDLLFRKVQTQAATRICALPPNHPLYPVACRAAKRFVNRHRSPLHYLFHITQLNPRLVETISPIRRHPTYKPSLTTKISSTKDTALELAQKTHESIQYKVYSDGSSYEGGVGASAILYKNDRIVKICRYHLGTPTEHTVYEAELVGILLALFLLTTLSCQLTNRVLIGLDNQASIRALNNQSSKPSHYLIDNIHTAAENLQAKQDKLQNAPEFRRARQRGRKMKARTRGVFDLRMQWVPGHMDFAPNDKADEHAKRAAEGDSSPREDLPKLLKKPLPASISALRQELKSKIQKRWARQWKTSPRYRHMRAIDKSTPSKKWLKLVSSLSRAQASIIVQLRTGRIGLNKFLHRIQRAESPSCPSCDEHSDETIHHFLFECHHYRHERHTLQRKLRRRATNLSYLLSNPAATLPLLKYIHTTRRLKQTFGAVYSGG